VSWFSAPGRGQKVNRYLVYQLALASFLTFVCYGFFRASLLSLNVSVFTCPVIQFYKTPF
jgi:hypothetical protein